MRVNGIGYRVGHLLFPPSAASFTQLKRSTSQIGPAQRHLFSRKGDKTCYRIQNHQGGAFVESSCMWKLGDRTYVYTPGNGPDDESQCILAPHALDVLETGDQMLAAMANERAVSLASDRLSWSGRETKSFVLSRCLPIDSSNL